MMFLTLETLIGITCALTSLENVLRGIAQSDSFIRFWIWKLIYWDLPPHIFFFVLCFHGMELNYVVDISTKKNCGQMCGISVDI